MMCNPEDHPVGFEVYQTPNFDNQFYGFQYTGNISNNILFSYYSCLFQGFAFNSVNEDVGRQRLKCHVEICDIDTENSPCSTGCYGDEATTTTSTTTSSTTTTTTSSTTTTTTSSTTTTTTTSTSFQHRFCKTDIWSAECLMENRCYTYVHYDDYFYNYETYESYSENYECEYTLSTVCNPNFIDSDNNDCEAYNRFDDGCAIISIHTLLHFAVSSPNEGVMTGLNCPVCGCGEDGPIRMGDRDNSRSLTDG